MSTGWTAQQAREHEMRVAMQRRLASEERTRTKIREKHENHNPPQGLPATVAEQAQRPALVKNVSREAAGGNCVARRAKITYIVRAVRPCDYDNWSIKCLQDGIVASGILEDDNWKVLSGEVISEKAASKDDEGTTVIIETPPQLPAACDSC